MRDIPTTYDQSKEAELYQLWKSSGYFNPDNLTGKPFTIIMPPPNANGKLHLGHVVFVTPEDIMIRYQRMQGRKTLWLPGTDHAGFETQVVFEKKLEKEGRSRFQMTQEEFYKEAWDFVQENKTLTEEGIKSLGASADWSRNMFTLDPKVIKIVHETFEKMYNDGLIYRGNRICNWCTKHQTGLSDLETEYEERTDPLYYIKYGPFVLATVRPETKFGDTALAVNPKDKRYKKYIGQEIEAVGLLGKFKIKMIADDLVEKDFGTGVVKVTPAHDAVDFEIWQKHKDEIPGPKQVIDKRGKMDLPNTKYHGLKVAEARKMVVKDLQKAGLIEKIDKTYKHNVSLCYKCKNVIEPLVIPQWYVAMTKQVESNKLKITSSLRDLAVHAVKTKKIKFIPARYEKIFMHWMNNIRDWPISRQIWWGIPIPVWYCGGMEKTSQLKMGWADVVVPRLFAGMTRTYRIHDHHYKLGDHVAFENSQTQKILGYGTITNIERMPINKIPLDDPSHKTSYKNLDELLTAFRRHYPPTEKITESTEAILYTYTFEPIEKSSDGCGQIIISADQPDKCPACGGTDLIQDPDTFDTWFSSGQWPYAALKANSDKDLAEFYPTDVMETGWEILFFWVARMIMFGLYLTDKIPFHTVYLHGILRDKHGQKMSKSKGNTIDPKIMSAQYGIDALRMAVIVGNLPGNDSTISEEKIRGYRNFANKIWNASRFVLQNTEPLRGAEGDEAILKKDRHASLAMVKKVKLTAPDKAILKELEIVTKDATRLIEKYDFAHAAENLYHYFWHNFADKIIEESKSKLTNPETRKSAQAMLKQVLETNLKLLHPFMPFVTEAVWQLSHKDLLMIQKWPTK